MYRGLGSELYESLDTHKYKDYFVKAIWKTALIWKALKVHDEFEEWY